MVFFNKVPMTFPLCRKVNNTIFYKKKNRGENRPTRCSPPRFCEIEEEAKVNLGHLGMLA